MQWRLPDRRVHLGLRNLLRRRWLDSPAAALAASFGVGSVLVVATSEVVFVVVVEHAAHNMSAHSHAIVFFICYSSSSI